MGSFANMGGRFREVCGRGSVILASFQSAQWMILGWLEWQFYLCDVCKCIICLLSALPILHHASRTGSENSHGEEAMFDVLPLLKPSVMVRKHAVFYLPWCFTVTEAIHHADWKLPIKGGDSSWRICKMSVLSANLYGEATDYKRYQTIRHVLIPAWGSIWGVFGFFP